MKDEAVVKLYAAVRDVVEAIGDQAFVDYGEVQNRDTKARMDALRREFKFMGGQIPRYPKPFRAVFSDDDKGGSTDFKTEDEAAWACEQWAQHSLCTARYYDRREMWK